ncbi:MAG TPA: family 20 glycosylhydrolase, partial [Bacteroidota bacterium]|nr:family 20 glycosylhydrolase [Bacteroidota bacterium]
MNFSCLKRAIVYCVMATSVPLAIARSGDPIITVIPRPAKLLPSPGQFTLNDSTLIVCDYSESRMVQIAEYLAERLRTATGYSFRITDAEHRGKSNYIRFQHINRDKLGNEGYELDVGSRAITLRSYRTPGLFYAVQTLLQLLPAEIFSASARSDVVWTMPCVAVSDAPRFRWRGMHLDVCRHFFPKEFIKRYIDFIALYKMNTFHWHLTEDQGWRIEIKKYPKLTQIGAWRDGSMVGPYSDLKYDTVRYGGFYSQEDVKEIVAYAASRQVTIIPEIEMPGHSLAALASYPELSCTGGPFTVGKAWGVYDDVYCPKETTFKFLENVLTEVCMLFPGKYIHIGGDEVSKTRWKNCAHCQALIRKKRLKGENGLQSYLIRRIEKFLNSKGKQIIGWDEILEGGLAPKAAVMSWRGTEGGIAAAKQRHNVVMSPGSYCYFDHYQGDERYEPLAIGGYTTVEKVYSYDPVPTGLSSGKRKYIMGAQGNVWTEYIQKPQHVEYMAMPRMAALAEVLWSPMGKRDYKVFQDRLLRHFRVLDQLGVNYAKAIFEITTTVRALTTADGVSFELSTPFGARGIHYTTGGEEPTANALQYNEPIAIRKSMTVKTAFFEDNKRRGNIIDQQFVISKSTGKKILLKTPPHENYDDQGAF